MSRFQAGDGVLIVRAKGASHADSSPLTIRARDESYLMQVAAKVESGCNAALSLEYNPNVAVFAELKGGQMTVYGPKGQLAPREWAAEAAWLRLVNRKNRVEILVSADGKTWQSLTADVDVSDFDQNGQHGGFQAARPALAASGTGNVHFSSYRYSAL